MASLTWFSKFAPTLGLYCPFYSLKCLWGLSNPPWKWAPGLLLCVNASLVSNKVLLDWTQTRTRIRGWGLDAQHGPGHCGSLLANPSLARQPACRATMAGFIPGLLPANHSQEKEFAQAYEDVLERYKGKESPYTYSCGVKLNCYRRSWYFFCPFEAHSRVPLEILEECYFLSGADRKYLGHRVSLKV